MNPFSPARARRPGPPPPERRAGRRTLNDKPEQYAWWSARGAARANNVGRRLDYHLTRPALAALARKAAIYTGQMFSDHAPLTIDCDFKP